MMSHTPKGPARWRLPLSEGQWWCLAWVFPLQSQLAFCKLAVVEAGRPGLGRWKLLLSHLVWVSPLQSWPAFGKKQAAIEVRGPRPGGWRLSLSFLWPSRRGRTVVASSLGLVVLHAGGWRGMGPSGGHHPTLHPCGYSPEYLTSRDACIYQIKTKPGSTPGCFHLANALPNCSMFIFPTCQLFGYVISFVYNILLFCDKCFVIVGTL